MAGEYTDVQLNWILHENGMTKERLDTVSDWIAYADPSIAAIKFLTVCAFFSFALKLILYSVS